MTTKRPRIAVAGDRFLVRREAKKKVTKGGIHLPESMAEDAVHGTVTAVVLAVGPGKLCDDGSHMPSVIAGTGDRLLLDSVHSSWWIDDPESPGDRLHFVEARDVLGVLTD